VQKGGKHVTSEDVTRARHKGATDEEIHDTVLIAAAFCMFNRYWTGSAHGNQLIPKCIARWEDHREGGLREPDWINQ